MKLKAWVGVIGCAALAATATASAQSSVSNTGPGASSGQAAAPSKAALAAVRQRVQTLVARVETLRDFLAQHRMLVARRPSGHGEGDEAKRAYEQQLAAWSTQLERLLRSIDGARAALAEAERQLEAALGAKLPSSLAVEVENARADAAAERGAAEEALASSKPEPERPAKRGKTKAAKEAPAP